MTRQVRFHDRYGHHLTTEPTLEQFAELYDSIASVGPDEDWRDVAIIDSDEWCVTFTPDAISFENVEAGDEEGEIRPVTRDLALAVADAFLHGDFAMIRARLTSPVQAAPRALTERSDENLFTTFVAAPPETMIRAVEELLLLPWNTGADAPLERTVEGMPVTSSDDIDLHDLQFIQSLNLGDDYGEGYVAVLARATPVVAGITEATTREWGEPLVLGPAVDLHACTALEVGLHVLGVDDVLAWRRDERYVLFFAGVHRATREYAAAFWVASRSVVEDVAYDIAPDAEEDGGGLDVNDAWAVIERVLGEVCPDVAATLRGPATAADLDRLARTVGRDLPTDLVQSLRRHDGQDNPTQLLDLFDHHTLLSAAAMIEQSDLLADAVGDDVDDVIDWMAPEKVRAIPNCRGWLQFTAVEGQGYALDLDPLPAGEVGQVIHLPVDGPTPAPEFDSYRAWLSHLATRLASGAFHLDDDGALSLTSDPA